MAKRLIVVAHVINIVHELWADDAMAAHHECDVCTAVLESSSSILGGIRPVAEHDDAHPSPWNANVVA